MWLPLVLITRYGWPGFWVFAIPNILGCAAMGYLVRSRESSMAMVQAHRGPMRWFSVATIAYQLFFLAFIFGEQGWMVGMSATTLPGLFVPLIAFGLALAASWLPWRAWPWLGTLVFAATMGTWCIVGTQFSERIEGSGSEPGINLWPLAPLIILGFLACPWLDPTFHRARQLAPSRHAFGVFGITFFAVLLFVTGYWHIDPPAPWGLILAFFIYQATFTMSAHLRELRLLSNRKNRPAVLSSIALVGIVIGYGVWLVRGPALAEPWLDDIYLRFLALYGLVFPAWILAFMLGKGSRTPANYLLLVIGLVIALPMAEAGMLHTSKWWLVPAVVVVLATSAIISTRSRQGPMPDHLPA